MITFIILYSALSLIFTKKRLFLFVSILSILTLLSLYWPISSKNISYKSQVNKLETLLSSENISLPLWEKSLENLDKNLTYDIISIIDELTEKYNKDKVFNKIISYDYDDNRYSARMKVRDYLWVDDSDKDYYNNPYLYVSYRQDTSKYDEIEIAWYSKLYRIREYNEDTWNNILRLDLNNKEYRIDLSDYIPQLVEKSDLYKKNDYTNEESEELHKPALILDWEDYKLVITWFHWERNRVSEKIQLNSIEWYILIK